MSFERFLNEKIEESLKDNNSYQEFKKEFNIIKDKLDEYNKMYDNAYLIESNFDEYGEIAYYYRDNAKLEEMREELNTCSSILEENNKKIEDLKENIANLKQTEEACNKKIQQLQEEIQNAGFFVKFKTKKMKNEINLIESDKAKAKEEIVNKEKLIKDKNAESWDLENTIEYNKKILNAKELFDQYMAKEKIDARALERKKDNLKEKIEKMKAENVKNIILNNIDKKEVVDVLTQAIKSEGQYNYEIKELIYYFPNKSISVAYKFIYDEARSVLEKNNKDLVEELKNSINI